MKTVEQAWKERGVDDDMPPPDEYVNGWFDALDNAAIRGAAREDDATDEARAGKFCSMGVGCGESGICYAMAHGRPSECGRN